MNMPLEFLNHEVARAIGWSLIHLVWQGALVALFVAGALRLMRHHLAAARYAIATGGLVLMLVLPVTTALYVYTTPVAVPFESAQAATSVAPASEPLAAKAQLTGASSAAQAPVLERVRQTVDAALPRLVIVWLLGVLILAGRLAGGVIGARRLCRDASPAPAEWRQRFDSLRRRMRISRPIRLLESALIDVPMVIGWFRPVVLVPVAALTGLTPHQLRLILVHELAHIRRNDHLVNLLQTVAEIVLFYHPAVWWLSERVRVERENCCDDLVVERCGSSLHYARALLELESLRVSSPQVALAANGGSLHGRVLRLVRPTSATTERWISGASLFGLVGLLLVGAPLAVFAQFGGGSDDSQVDGIGPATVNVATAAGLPAPASMPAPAAAAPSAPTPPTFAGPPAPAPPIDTGVRGLPADAGPGSPDRQRDTLSVDDLIAMRIHGVTPEFVREMESLGYRGLSVQDLVAMGIHRVTPEFVRAIQASGVSSLSHHELVAMRIHDVTPQYIQAVRALGIAGVDQASHFVEMRIHRVTPEYVRQMQAAGIGNVSRSHLVAMRMHGVTPELVHELESLGYGDLSHQQLVEMGIHRVTPGFIREMAALGFRDLPVNQLVTMRIHRVTPDLIRELREAGLADLTPDQLVRLRISGVDRDLIRSRHQAPASDQ